MSPEQAAGHLDQIDTRTDVYGLGVILFRLLTGESPHDLSGTRYDVLRRIAEEEVKRPREINKDVDRELEALLLKALAHDPKDRYPSAGALAQDIENYLTGEPLTARPPTTAYFLRKRIWKYRVPVAIASSVLAVLISMGVFSYVRVVQERNKTKKARDNAQKEAHKAKAVFDLMRRTVLTRRPLGIRTRKVLKQTAEDVGTKFAGQPEIEAAVRTAMGQLYLFLDQVEDAESQFRRAVETRRLVLGEGHPDTIESLVFLLLAVYREGNFDEWEEIARQLLDVRRRFLGEGHRDTLYSLALLGVVLWRRGKLDEAEASYEEAVEIRGRVLGEKAPGTLASMNSLAIVLEGRGKLDGAEGVLRQVLELRRDELGELHPRTLRSMNALAFLLRLRGKLNEAETRNRRILEIRRLLHGEKHPGTLWAMSNLAVVLEEQAKVKEAQALRRREFEIRKELLDRKSEGTRPGGKAGVSSDMSDPTQEQGNAPAYDGFDRKLTLDWKILHPDPSHFSLTKQPGALTITTQDGGFIRANADYKNLFLIDCPAARGEDFQLTTCISSFKPVADYNQAGLICCDNDDNYLKFSYEWNSMRIGPIFDVGVETEGRYLHVSFFAPLDLQRVWLRVTKRGNRYAFSTSLDGEAFSRMGYPEQDSTGLFQGAVAWGDGSVARVGVFAKNASEAGAPEIDASFDSFEVTSLSGTVEGAEELISARGEGTNVETP